MLCLERKRAERSGRRLVLMLVESKNLLKQEGHRGIADKITSALSHSTRDTDIKGWHRDGAVVGVIFTEIPLAQESIVDILSTKTKNALNSVLSSEQAAQVKLSFHSFPDRPQDNSDPRGSDGTSGTESFSTIYPDLALEIQSRRVPLFAKRCLDIAGSLLAIVALSPDVTDRGCG